MIERKEKRIRTLLIIFAIIVFSINIGGLIYINQKLNSIELRLETEMQKMEEIQNFNKTDRNAREIKEESSKK